MSKNGVKSVVKSMIYDDEKGTLKILDQLALPSQTIWMDIRGVDDGWNAIKHMHVRGAPAIAIVGLLSLAVELRQLDQSKYSSIQNLATWIEAKLEYLLTSRPTAVNLTNECQAAQCIIQDHVKGGDTKESLIRTLIAFAEDLLVLDAKCNIDLSEHGAQWICEQNPDEKLNILTICNTGSLATAAVGTALGVIRSLHARDALNHVYFLETRPHLQGARLTAYELFHENIPATMICDSAAAWLMKTETIHAVIAGCDHVTANGDTANKIGTYMLAVLAQAHDVPFYIAKPTRTFNPRQDCGSTINIEQRHAKEVTHVMTSDGNHIPISVEGISVWNPAFDVTPARLVTGGFITEHGVLPATHLKRAHSSGWKLEDLRLNDAKFDL